MPCPVDKPDDRIEKCMLDIKVFPPCPDPYKPDPTHNANCPKVPLKRTYELRIKEHSILGNGVVVLVAMGTDHGIKRAWTATLIQKGTRVANGNGKITELDKTSTRIKFSLELLQMINDDDNGSLTVRLTAP